jgi:DUF1680 family protein
MILKFVSALPQYIYGYDDSQNLYVNLFVGSDATIKLNGSNIAVKQTTGYPWNGNSKIEINPAQPKTFAVNMRIPGWAQGKENPFDLYRSAAPGAVTLKVNGKAVPVKTSRGYATISRTWKKVMLLNWSCPFSHA